MVRVSPCHHFSTVVFHFCLLFSYTLVVAALLDVIDLGNRMTRWTNSAVMPSSKIRKETISIRRLHMKSGETTDV